MTYRYELARRARNYLRRLDRRQQDQVVALLRLLCEDPFDSDISRPLQGQFAGHRRARIGDLRVIYRVDGDRLLVSVSRIGPRGDVYKP